MGGMPTPVTCLSVGERGAVSTSRREEMPHHRPQRTVEYSSVGCHLSRSIGSYPHTECYGEIAASLGATRCYGAHGFYGALRQGSYGRLRQGSYGRLRQGSYGTLPGVTRRHCPSPGATPPKASNSSRITHRSSLNVHRSSFISHQSSAIGQLSSVISDQ